MFQLIAVVSSLSNCCCIIIVSVVIKLLCCYCCCYCCTICCCCRHCCCCCCCCFMGVSSLIISVSYHHTVPSMRCDQNIMIVVMLVLKLNNESCKIKSTKINGNHILSYNTAWCCKSNTCTTYMSPKVL